jgi:peptidoglycan hydrolase-like protein with peptidoglycan-binding domain
VGKVWLHDTPKYLTKYGVRFGTHPGWELRSRSSGGFESVMAIGTHHTASGANPGNQMTYMWNNAPDRPIGNIFIARDGLVTLGAAGASNTQGRGGPIRTSKGTIPKDRGNMYFVSIEGANTGLGQEWPEAQMQSLVLVCAALCEQFGLDPMTDVLSHWEWVLPSQPSRKVDPMGPTPSMPDVGGSAGNRRWDDSALRRRVAAAIHKAPAPVSSFDPANGVYGSWPRRNDKATLRRGSRGNVVKYLQGVILNKAGGGITVDGMLGPQTENRIKDCQRLIGIKESGVVGKQVWDFIDFLAKS